MIKRKKILLFLCLIISVLNVPKVYADPIPAPIPPVSWGAENSSKGDGGTGGGAGNGTLVDWIEAKEGNIRIQYRYSISFSSQTTYDPKAIFPNGNEIKSGTWVGINILETQQASWNVSNIKYKEIKKVWTCTKKIQHPGTYEISHYIPIITIINGKPNITWKPIYKYKEGYTEEITTEKDIVKDYYESFNCQDADSTPSSIDKEIDNASGIDKSKEIYTLAHNRAAGMVGAALSELQIITDELNEKKQYITKSIKGQLIGGSDSGIVASGSIEKVYGYKPSNICINLKTGKVKYNGECKLDEEVKIKPYIYEGVEYWQYFSPLNMKSGSNFSLMIKNNAARLLSGGECHSIMDNYKNQYQNYIISKKGAMLNGNYCKNGNCNNLNTGSGSDWQEVSNGCYFSTVLNFDVVQKYYFEEMKNNELKFNGYNLYYRPININNPFPTTPTENSIWYEWFNSTNKTPNLKESFNEITYSVAVPNKLADTIRAYNVNNPYPSFDKLSLNGTSSFLQSIGVESLTKDKTNKLGEGTKTCIKNGTVSIGSDCS